MKRFSARCFAKSGIWIALILVLLAAASPAAPQKNKDKKKDRSASDSQDSFNSSMPDSQAIDQAVGEMLGYWQIGDVDSLHKFYDDNVVVVSGLWEPPVIGWANFAKAYQEERAHVSGTRMDRSNTLIKVNGNFAWATYQFVYQTSAEGKIAQFRGHTTLILNKESGHWVIVLNHSSIVDSSISNSGPTASSAQPGQH